MRHFRSSFPNRVRAAMIGGGFALVLATASLTPPVLADSQPTTTAATQEAIGPHTHQIHGTVKGTPAAGATSFTVSTERYGDVTVTFASAMLRDHGHGHGHGHSFAVSNLTELKDGDRVVVQGRTSADGKTFVARRVHLLPAKGAAAHPTHLLGTITAVSTSNGNTMLTVSPADGSASQTVTVTSDAKVRPEGKTVADLKVGTKVTLVSRNGAASGVVIMPS